MKQFGAVQFKVLPRSPDCDPIKNVLSPIERRLKEDAIVLNITRNFIMTFWKGYRKQCATNYQVQSIKNIIKSMHQRMEEIA